MRRHVAAAAGILVMTVLPLALDDRFLVNLLVLAGIFTIMALGLTLLFGYAGQISFGHAGFFGLGAYTSAILSTRHGFPVPLGILAGALVAAGLALLIGGPMLRLRGYSLAMGTLAFGLAMFVLFNELTELTNGPIGMPGLPGIRLLGIELDEPQRYYYLVWVVALVVFVFARNIANSRIGRALKAVASSEVAAQVAGVNVVRVKVQIFAVSGLLAGLAGGLYAHYVTFISSDLFNVHLSTMLVVIIAIGGMRSPWGALVGAAVLTGLPELLRQFQDWAELVYGLVLILVFMFVPSGLAGIAGSVGARVRARRNERALNRAA